MHIPSSTYRIQLHKDFTIKNLVDIIPYLHQLGISTIYASPILHATPGSMHGYDVLDSQKINPEIGTLKELKTLSEKLKALNMYWLQDIVPNHMAFHTGNTRLMDVMERGPDSPYYNYFDINWKHPSFIGKLCTPFLGKEIDTCIQHGEIKFSFSEKGFTISYFETHYPLSIRAIKDLQQLISNKSLQSLLTEFITSAATLKSLKDWQAYKTKWINRVSIIDIKDLIIEANDSVQLKKIVGNLFYALSFWKHADQEINYRRFFTVNELICLRMEDEEVFNEYHRLLYELYKDGIIHGLRVDHIDGLKEPSTYLQRLRKLFGKDIYIIAEKILEAKEEIPQDWQLQGTSGYEFLATVNQLTTNKKGAKQLVKFYQELIPDQKPYKELIIQNKRLILEEHMHGEWQNLLSYFTELHLNNNFELARLKNAIAVLMISFPVYRLYPSTLPLKGEDLMVFKETFEKASLLEPTCKKELNYLFELFTTQNNDNALEFIKRMMQFTGPLTAKGVEDTTFYLYNPLISHDEVGDAPSVLGISINNFHQKMTDRQQTSALSLNATNTHDTKRGEDARVRLNALSEIPDQWESCVKKWIAINKAHRQDNEEKRIPGINDEYFIYQSIIGGFPEDYVVTEKWLERLKAYLTKAFREAKFHSNWTAPDEVYESGCHTFVKSILMPGSEFVNDLTTFLKDIYQYAYSHSLLQVVLKCTTPGIPDIYQGCELFDLSFVDPDNRRPVDYEKRKTILNLINEQGTQHQDELIQFLNDTRQEGSEKLFVTHKLLNFRKDNNELFIRGKYKSLQVSTNNNIVAYARCLDDAKMIIVILAIASEGNLDGDIILPENCPSKLQDVLTNEIYTGVHEKISIARILTKFQVAVLSTLAA
jgi:(1->4)-alpha-D-glucan 1-alpha-D-glucosylmutase